MNRILFAALLQIILCFRSFGQINIQLPANNALPVLSQEEIDRIAIPAEGYAALNKTTNCINYYLNGIWFEQCGNCLPHTAPYFIDSIIQTSSFAAIYFRKSEKDTLHLQVGKDTYNLFAAKSPHKVRVSPNADSMKVVSTVSNKCYTHQQQQVHTIPLKKMATAAPYNLQIEGKKIEVRGVNNNIWFCSDWIAGNLPPAKFPLLSYSDKMCPTGWKLPTRNDWENLLKNYGDTFDELFDKPTAENLSIGLNKHGAYAVEEKKTVGANFVGTYWTSDKTDNGSRYLINISANGYMFIAEKTENVRASLRCIK